jgi:integrase
MSTPPARIQFTGPATGAPAQSAAANPTGPTAEITAAALSALIGEWQLAMRAEGKGRGTIDIYTDGSRRYLGWCQATDRAPIVRTSLQTWMAHLLDTGSAPGTVRTRHLAVRRLAAWLIATGGLPADPFLGIKGPVQRQAVLTPLSADELRALIETCTRPTRRIDEPFHHRRDEAIIRLMMETGIRAGELIALRTDDLDPPDGRITVRCAKGGRRRTIPVGPDTTRAIRDYLDLRQQHPAAKRPDPVAGHPGDPVRVRRPRQGPPPPRQPRRHQRLPPAQAAPHRGPPLARRRRLRVRAHGHGRLDPHRHARPLHPGHRRRPRRPRGASAQPRGPLIRDEVRIDW